MNNRELDERSPQMMLALFSVFLQTISFFPLFNDGKNKKNRQKFSWDFLINSSAPLHYTNPGVFFQPWWSRNEKLNLKKPCDIFFLSFRYIVKDKAPYKNYPEFMIFYKFIIFHSSTVYFFQILARNWLHRYHNWRPLKPCTVSSGSSWNGRRWRK